MIVKGFGKREIFQNNSKRLVEIWNAQQKFILVNNVFFTISGVIWHLDIQGQFDHIYQVIKLSVIVLNGSLMSVLLTGNRTTWNTDKAEKRNKKVLLNLFKTKYNWH